MDILTNALLLTLAAAPLVILAMWRGGSRHWMPALLFLALLGVDDLLTSLPGAVAFFDVIPGRWNWDGKLFSFLVMLAFVVWGPISRREAGVTFEQRQGSMRAALMAVGLLTAASFGIGLLFGGGGPDAETVAFQLTAPGLAEELAYRGVFIGLLHQALLSTETGRNWWPTVITAVAFGVWHGLGVQDGVVSFDAMSGLFPFLGSLAYGWLRDTTGSIVFPVFAHNLGNSVALIGAAITG